jgi:hypothetical protein
MSLQQLAKQVQKRGRGDDKMLVHMTPGEVKGLQALAMANGGSLSINPDTGLVEAGFLKNMLPMIAGAALTGLTGGIVNPLTAGMIVGGFEGIRTGDVGKGLMAGLGAYGGAGLTAGLTSAGSQALATPEAVAGQLGTPAATTPGSQAAMLAEQNAGFGVEGLESVRSAAATATPTSIPQFDGSTLIGDAKMGAQAALPTTSQQVGAGFGQLGSEAGRSAVYNALPNYTLPAAGMSVVAGALEPEPIPDTSKEKREYGEDAFLSPNFQAYTPRRPNPYYTPTGLGYAGGGLMDVMMARGGSFDDVGQTDDFAMGGSIGGYSDGGRMLKGPGDGMSDSIPGVIGNKQPARLADGEFVVPADVVSHLGNGSTDAGAKRLYSMMDKVRNARTGKKKQAKAIKAERYMPA